MSQLVSMKLDPQARKAMYEPTAVAPEGPLYPWGLSINLDNDSLEKLGINLPEVGSTLALEARVVVTACSSNESAEGGRTSKSRSVTLQITDLSLDKADDDDVAEKLYGKD